MLESSIQAKIMRYLKQIPESFVWKQHAGQYAKAGLPDIMFVWKGLLYCFEVKQPGNKATKLQESTMKDLRAAGARATVVYGLEDVKGIIEEVLQ